MANNYGGARAGAGRKKGSRKSRNLAIADRAAAEGITPLEVMLFVMRDHFAAKRYAEAAEVAHHAAPYVHPRLVSAHHTGQATDAPVVVVLGDARLAALCGTMAPDDDHRQPAINGTATPAPGEARPTATDGADRPEVPGPPR